ncbi:helix-turn-helix domain-containing protein [Amphibacillus xylanus]|uniref:Putative DNA-binding protein n=1 Tax=Amphibacillus xylanus (strain ATCC 51415 / DSM 6626 / JCM 7361 / LMG 17667 / NBRC 15112 / Ep01) TaxID=698758 RepID=K0IVB1_AMPXN|nr:helix-turn-helix transcriptional regulator [Amphibacillus xylanus]BAM46315.1 putative DNA-binding protein [Amphibacillus xylanus NBRC 15112]
MTAFDRVKKLCEEQKISIVELEEKVGFGRNSLYSWKKNNPSSEKLEKVADFFNVSTDYLLGRTDIKYIHEPDTIAAHHDGEDWTEEELEEIERFKEFVRMKRSQQE